MSMVRSRKKAGYPTVEVSFVQWVKGNYSVTVTVTLESDTEEPIFRPAAKSSNRVGFRFLGDQESHFVGVESSLSAPLFGQLFVRIEGNCSKTRLVPSMKVSWPFQELLMLNGPRYQPPLSDFREPDLR